MSFRGHSEQLTSTGGTAAVNAGRNGRVIGMATANTGAFSAILQANIDGNWVNVGTAITAINVSDTVVVPAGVAVRFNATAVGTSVDLSLVG